MLTCYVYTMFNFPGLISFSGFKPCEKFHQVYRRLVRTLSRSSHAASNVGLFYIDASLLPYDNKHHVSKQKIMKITTEDGISRCTNDSVTTVTQLFAPSLNCKGSGSRNWL